MSCRIKFSGTADTYELKTVATSFNIDPINSSIQLYIGDITKSLVLYNIKLNNSLAIKIVGDEVKIRHEEVVNWKDNDQSCAPTLYGTTPFSGYVGKPLLLLTPYATGIGTSDIRPSSRQFLEFDLSQGDLEIRCESDPDLGDAVKFLSNLPPATCDI